MEVHGNLLEMSRALGGSMRTFALTAHAVVACCAFALHGAVASAAQSVSAEPKSQQCNHEQGENSPLVDHFEIRSRAKDAYIWALAPEFVYRFLNYNSLKTAPVNRLAGGTDVAAWNNAATNAGDASVLYLNAMINLSGKPTEGGAAELMLTVPPSQDPTYYVVNFLDQYINTVGSIGTRTTASAQTQTYLIAGPQSVYQHKKTVTIGGQTFNVLPTATNLNWMLIRIRADTLAPSSAPNSFPASSTANVYKNVVQKFALNTLDEFRKNGNQPIYQSSFSYKFTKEQLKRAQRWETQPTNAVDFFGQAGCSLAIGPLPAGDVGFGGMPLADLPPYVPGQADATVNGNYENPSWGQQPTLDEFRAIGLTEKGYAVPRNWGTEQLNALQLGLEDGRRVLDTKLNAHPERSQAFWKYDTNAGTYVNTFDQSVDSNYVLRGAIVLAGGSANLGVDAVYAQTNNIGLSPVQLDGNKTYKIKFAAPTPPGNGTIPPLALTASGNPLGFWSMHVYQPDSSQSAAPFLMQTASLNTAYSIANLDVVSVDPGADTITVANTTYSAMKPSSPVFFSGSAAQSWGLNPNQPYYIVAEPTQGMSGTTPTLTFKVAQIWQQCLSSNQVPIQNSGAAGPPVDLTNGSGSFKWGPVQAVSQLGSQQITSNLLKRDDDGSYTLWVGPSLPNEADPHNWIPTPSDDYYKKVYNSGLQSPASCDPSNPPSVQANTGVRLMMRMYYPSPACPGPSILPCNGQTTYIFPLVEQY
jgi:hypothetical protein